MNPLNHAMNKKTNYYHYHSHRNPNWIGLHWMLSYGESTNHLLCPHCFFLHVLASISYFFLLFLSFEKHVFSPPHKIGKAPAMGAPSRLSPSLLNNNRCSYCYMIVQPLRICILHTNTFRAYLHSNASNLICSMYPICIAFCFMYI